MIKKIFKTGLFILIIIIIGAFAVPLLFKNKIVSKVKESINKNLNAKVEFKDVDISLFRRFPRVSVALDSFRILGIKNFDNDTLLSTRKINVALNLISIIKGGDMEVHSFMLDAPRIHAIVDKDGKANWDIMKEDSDSGSANQSKPFRLELQEYSFNNGYLSYVDEISNLKSEILNFNHTGSGDFMSDNFMLQTVTNADSVNFSLGSVPYLINAAIRINTNLLIDNKTNKYQFETNNILINDLQLATNGFIQLIDDSTWNMDVNFKAPSNKFKSILSLVPTIYKKDFDKVNTSGHVDLNGFVKGTYSYNRMPAYSVNLNIENGFFQYPDLPKPVKNINIKVQLSNPDGVPDHTVVNIQQGHIEINNEPFDFRLLLKNPVSDLFIEGVARGNLDLFNIAQFIKLESGTKLSGLIQADVSARGNLSALEQQNYEAFYASGTVAINGLQYASKDYPDGIRVNNLFMTFNPRDVTISDFDGLYKRSNFTASGSVSNLLPYILQDKLLSGKMNVSADKMNLNDWMGTTADTAVTSHAATDPFVVPANINFDINASAGRLLYDKLEIEQLSGNVLMKDESVVLNNITGDALEGSMVINGAYSTRESKKRPHVIFNYDVRGLDVQKTFYAFNTIQQLLPAGEYLSGRLNSKLNVSGNLGGNMMPDLRSLTGQGTLLLIEGFLKKFAPLEKLADLLNVRELEEITMKDVKNYIEFTNGMVLVKPFTVKHSGITMIIGGMHGLDQSLDYNIDLSIPRALMGTKGNAYVDNLVTQVNNKSIPIKVGETAHLQVKMGGTMLNPQFKTELKEVADNMADRLKQQAIDFARAKSDSSKRIVTDTALSVKKQIEKDIREDIRRIIIRDTAAGKSVGLDSVGRRVKESGKGVLEELLKRKKVN